MTSAAAPTDSPASATPPDPGVASESRATSWLFNHPSLGLALRYHLKPLLLYRLALIQALGLLGMVFLASQLNAMDDDLQLILERVPIGRIIFVLTAASVMLFLTLVLPITLNGIFSRERRERCFDQVVATGVSPLRLLLGRGMASLAAMAFLTLSAMPFLLFGVASGAVPASELLMFLVVLAVYLTGLTAWMLSRAVAFDDLIVPTLMSLTILIGHLIALSPIPTVIAAASPLRMLLDPIQQAMGLATISGWYPEGILFGQRLPAATLCCIYWMLIAGFSLFSWCIGPDHVLTGGLASFDAVALGSGSRARATQTIVGRSLLRQVQMAFLYENLPARLRRLEPLNHEIFRLGACLCLMALTLGILWPDIGRPTFQQIDDTFIWPFIGIATGIQLVWCYYGITARSAALDSRPPLTLASVSLDRLSVRRAALVIVLAAPTAMLYLYPALSGATVASLHPFETLPTLGLLAIYAATFHGLATVLSYLIAIRPLAASAHLMIVLTLFLTPILVLPLMAAGLLPEVALMAADVCPAFAIGSLASPNWSYNFPIADTMIRHHPSALPSTLFFGLLAVACAVSAGRLRSVTVASRPNAGTAPPATAAKATAVAMVVLCLLGLPPRAQAQESSSATPPQARAKGSSNRIRIDSEVGIGGQATDAGWIPIRVRLRSNAAPFQGTLWLMDGGTPLQQRQVTLATNATAHLSFALSLHSARWWSPWQTPLTMVLVEEGGQQRRYVHRLELSDSGTPVVAILDERGPVPVGARTLSLSLEHMPMTSARLRESRGIRSSSYNAGTPREELMVVFPELSLLPHNPLAFSGLSALVLSDADPDSLPAGVWRGIVGWVQRGGHLVVAGGRHSARLASPALAALLAPAGTTDGPLEPPAIVQLTRAPRLTSLAHVIAKSSPRGAPSASLPAGTSIPTAILSLGNDDQVLLSETTTSHGNLPLIVRRRTGLGAVTLIAMSPLDSPLRGTPLAMTLLETAFQSGPRYDEASASLYNALTPLRTDTSFLRPFMAWLSLYLLVLLTLGMVIRRWATNEMAIWMWLPALGIAFGLTTPLATLLGDRSSSLAEINLVELTTGSGVGMQTAGVLLWSGNGNDLNLTATGEDPLAFTLQRTTHGHRGKNPFLGPADPASGGLPIGPLVVPRWNTHSLIAQSLRPAQVTARVIVGPGEAEVDLRNHMDQPLRRLSLTLGIPEQDRQSDALLGMILRPGASTTGPGTPVLNCLRLGDLAPKSRMVTRLRGDARGSGLTLASIDKQLDEVDQTLASRALEEVWSQRLALRAGELGEAWLLAEIPPMKPRGVVGSPLIRRRADVQILAIRPTLHWQGIVPFGVSRLDIHRPGRPVIRGKRQPQRWETRLQLPSFLGPGGQEPQLDLARLVVRGLGDRGGTLDSLEIENVRTGQFEPLKMLPLGNVNSVGNTYLQLGDLWYPSSWDQLDGRCHAAVLTAEDYVRMPEQVVRLRETVPASQWEDAGLEQLIRLDIGLVWSQRKR